MSSPPPRTLNVGILIFTQVDILDFTGPLEIFACATHTPSPSFAFNTTLIAATRTIAANSRGCLTVTAGMSLEQAKGSIEEFDILVVPGAEPEVMISLAEGEGSEMDLIRAFDRSPIGEEGTPRILLSVCTGALLLGRAGVLSGLKATTHHLSLDSLKGIDQSVEVIDGGARKGRTGRYVDGGVNRNGTRIVTAGGVTCGLDASLFVVELSVGKSAAEDVAKMMEHEWTRV